MKERRLTQRPWFKLLTVVLLPLAAVLWIQLKLNPYYQTVFILFFINVILAAGLNFANGIAGVFSLGQAAFMALGAYISTLLAMDPELKVSRIADIPDWLARVQVPFAVAVLAACAIVAVIAAAVGSVILRARGHYLAVITLGLVIVTKSLLDNAATLTNGAKGLSGMRKYTTLPVAATVAVIALYALYRVKKSRFGRSMVALRDNEQAAESLGIRAEAIRLLAFVVSAVYGALGGALWAHLYRSIAPGMFYFSKTFDILEMSVLGGMATLSGAIPGAAVITFLPQLLANFENGFTFLGLVVPRINGFTNITMSVIFILVIIFRKGGIVKGNDYIVESMFEPATYAWLLPHGNRKSNNK